MNQDNKWIVAMLGDSSHGYFSQALRGISDTLAGFTRYGGTKLNTVVCSHDDRAWVEESLLDVFLEEPVGGLILAASSSATPNLERINSFIGRGVPVVQIDRRVIHLDTPWVGIDNAAAVHAATAHLVWHGCTRFASVGGRPEVSTNQARFEGFSTALREAHMEATRQVLWNCSEWDSSRIAIKGLLSRRDRPDALICFNGMATLGAMLAIKEMDLRCPADIRVIGFDDNPWSLLSSPSITMIRQPARAIGEKAAELIWQAMHQRPAGEEHYLPWELVTRQSCGCGGGRT